MVFLSDGYHGVCKSGRADGYGKPGSTRFPVAALAVKCIEGVGVDYFIDAQAPVAAEMPGFPREFSGDGRLRVDFLKAVVTPDPFLKRDFST
jgi:hypothetical protein